MHLNPARLVRLWPEQAGSLVVWSVQARIGLQARLEGQGDTLQNAEWQATLADLAFADKTGNTAAEGLAGRLDGRLTRTSDRWVINGELHLDKGELLTPQFYLNATAHPLALTGEWALDHALETLRVRYARLRLPGLLELTLQARMALGADPEFQMLKLRVQPLQVADVYRELLQPVLQGTPWGRFELAGKVNLTFDLQQDSTTLDLGLQDVAVDDQQTDQAPQRLALKGVNGHLAWNRSGEMRPSWLAWRSSKMLPNPCTRSSASWSAWWPCCRSSAIC